MTNDLKKRIEAWEGIYKEAQKINPQYGNFFPDLTNDLIAEVRRLERELKHMTLAAKAEAQQVDDSIAKLNTAKEALEKIACCTEKMKGLTVVKMAAFDEAQEALDKIRSEK